MNKRNFTCLGSLILVFLMFLSTSQPALADTVSIIRVSLSSGGDEADSAGYSPSISTDGRYVAFESTASNLVSGDTNGKSDIFVRDCNTNTTTRISVDSVGGQSNGSSYGPSISGDGRYVAFCSDATNLVTGDDNGKRDVFVHDRDTGITTRVSVSSDEVQSNDISELPQISSNGSYVVFQSEATNLIAGDTNSCLDVFLRDLVNGTTERVSISDDEVEGDGESSYPAISADGRYVGFSSMATNLVTGDTNNFSDVFVRDRISGSTVRVSVSSTGVEGNHFSGSLARPSLSDDGRYIVFQSGAFNLVDDDTNGQLDVFVHDIDTGATTRVSVSSRGDETNGSSKYAEISGDGRYVAFVSYANNLVTGDTNEKSDIFLHDLVFRTTIRVSVNSSLEEGNDGSSRPDISADGTALVFHSFASNLVVNDNNNVTDIFLASLTFIEVTNYIPLLCR